MIISKTRNGPGLATKADNLIPNGVKCNENVIWVSVLRLQYVRIFHVICYIWYYLKNRMIIFHELLKWCYILSYTCWKVHEQNKPLFIKSG